MDHTQKSAGNTNPNPPSTSSGEDGWILTICNHKCCRNNGSTDTNDFKGNISAQGSELSNTPHTSSVPALELPSSCHLCAYESERHSNLKRHLKTMHRANLYYKYQCCDTVFQDKADYRSHCRQIHQNGHECFVCGRRFSRRALLRRHQSVHTGLKEFDCHLCSYASSHKSNLERHYKTHALDVVLRGSDLLQAPRRYRKSVQPQPDSTTTPVPVVQEKAPVASTTEYPILRNILKLEPSSTNTDPSKLSHSIESILNRKDRPKPRPDVGVAAGVQPVALEFPSANLRNPEAAGEIQSLIGKGLLGKPTTVTTVSIHTPPPVALIERVAHTSYQPLGPIINQTSLLPFTDGRSHPTSGLERKEIIQTEPPLTLPWASPPDSRIFTTPAYMSHYQIWQEEFLRRYFREQGIYLPVPLSSHLPQARHELRKGRNS